MTRHAYHRHPSWGPLTLAAMLALVPGCTANPKPEYELVSFRNSRGLISYEYVPKKPQALKAPPPRRAPSLPSGSLDGCQRFVFDGCQRYDGCQQHCFWFFVANGNSTG